MFFILTQVKRYTWATQSDSAVLMWCKQTFLCSSACVCVNRSNSQWMCTFCVFRISQEYYFRNELTKEAAMARDMSQHMLECHYLFMRLCCANKKQAFTINPCLYVSLHIPQYVNYTQWAESHHLIYNRYIHVKQSLKAAHATSDANFSSLTHFGVKGTWRHRWWGGELQPHCILILLHTFSCDSAR